MTLAWSAFLLYVVVTLGLAWWGSRKTGNLESYALGSGHMSFWVVGLALAASMTSTATFVINPGIVWAYGLSAVLGYGLSAGLGLAVGIVVFSKGFRRRGFSEPALTVPQWIALAWGDRRLALLYAAVSLLLVSMVVLICYAMAGLLTAVLGFESLVPGYGFETALVVVVLFVFSYVFWGGTFAHAYTNTVQGAVMIVVAVLLILSGADLWGEMLARLGEIDPVLASPVNPSSVLFRNLFEVFGVNLLVGLALACQPHFLIKALYVETEREVNRYLAVAVVAGTLFNLVLLCGLYARVGESRDAVMAYVLESGLGIDGVIPAYVATSFSPAVAVLVTIALVAAGMSTLDGILVALSAIVANDVFLVLRRGDRRDPESGRLAFRVSRWTLVALAVLTIVLSLVQHRTKELSIAIFAQEGVYAVLIATFVPVLFGVFAVRVSRWTVVAASLTALLVHFGFRYGGVSLLTDADATNPGLTATYGLLASLVVAGAGWLVARRRPPSNGVNV
jgi:sodium/pantothenate symporter